MCFNVSVTKFTEYLEKRFQARMLPQIIFSPVYHASAFSCPALPVITNNQKEVIDIFKWGLIPFWSENQKKADEIKRMTFNAKAETVFEKPSFRSPIKNKRCLVLVDGFFEWHEKDGKKYPFYIKLKTGDAFALAAIWDVWNNKETGKEEKTFSVITTTANGLLEKIHNIKKRMPVILPKDSEKKWIGDFDEKSIKEMMSPFDENLLEAYTISKAITSKKSNTNKPEILEKFDYPELNDF